jgi:hypothetical protein
VGWSNLLAPAHEFFHLAAAAREGIGGRITSWSTSELDSGTLRGQVTAGWFGEIWFAAGFCILFVFLGRRFPKLTGAGPVGYMLATWARGYQSYDFTTGLHDYTMSVPGYSKEVLESVYVVARDTLVQGWTILSGLLVLVSVAAVVVGIVKKNRPRG